MKRKVVSSKPKPRQVTDTPALSSQHPSLGASSQSDVLKVEPVASKPVITCFNCSLPGHYQLTARRHCTVRSATLMATPLPCALWLPSRRR
jgi:hypothetical protein